MALNNTRFMTLPLNSLTFKSNSQLFKFSHLWEVVVIRRRKIAWTDPDTPPLRITTALQINYNFSMGGGDWELCWEGMGRVESMKWWRCGDGNEMALYIMYRREFTSIRGGHMRGLFHFAFCFATLLFALALSPRGCMNVALRFCRSFEKLGVPWKISVPHKNLGGLENSGGIEKFRRSAKI